MPNSQYFSDYNQAIRPNFKTWLKHFAFLFLTFITATIAGTLYPFGKIEILLSVSDDASLLEVLAAIPNAYFQTIQFAIKQLFTNPEILFDGLSFSVSALTILLAHEAGHYIACRIYGVDATLPYFIPIPPLISPAGTLGAFIRIKSPIPSRKAVFDIGVAGPLAGFVALIPIAILAIYQMQQITPEQLAQSTSEITFSDPLFLQIIGNFLGKNLSLGIANPFYFAAWLGLLVTALNLIPSGQLDGGHAIYAVFGEKTHKWTGRFAFLAMAVFTVLGWFYFNSPSGLLFTIILAIMLKVGHPEPYDLTPLDFKRKIVAIITLIVFILSFMPFPIKIT